MVSILLDASDVGYIIGVTIASFVGLIMLIFLLVLFSSVKVVEKGTAMVVERYGKFNRKLDPGLHFLIPFIEKPRSLIGRNADIFTNPYGYQEFKISQRRMTRIDLRESVLDFPLQSIITRDNVEIQIHPMLLFKIVDPVRACYEVYDLAHAVEKLVQTTLRSIIGDMGLDDTLASREEINRTLSQKISNVFLNWGFKLLKVELLEILPSHNIQEAMHKQIAAERMRRAAIITAEGYRERVKTEAEGECQSMIAISKGDQQTCVITAKGQGDAKVLKANAEAEAVRIMTAALKEFKVDTTQYIVGIKYIETLTNIAVQATKRIIYFPFETDVVGAQLLYENPF